MSPLSTAWVRYLASGFPRLPTRKKTPTAAATTTRIQATLFLLISRRKTSIWRPFFPAAPAAQSISGTEKPPERLHGQAGLSDSIENRFELLQTGADQEVPRPAVALRADQEEPGLPGGEALGPDPRDREAVGDSRQCPGEARGALGDRGDLQRQLREEAQVRPISRQRHDFVEHSPAAAAQGDLETGLRFPQRFDAGASVDRQEGRRLRGEVVGTRGDPLPFGKRIAGDFGTRPSMRRTKRPGDSRLWTLFA